MLRTAIDIGLPLPFLVDTQIKSAAMQGQQLPPGSPCRLRVDEDSIVAFAGSHRP